MYSISTASFNRAGHVHRVRSFLTELQLGQLWRCVPEDEAGKCPL